MPGRIVSAGGLEARYDLVHRGCCSAVSRRDDQRVADIIDAREEAQLSQRDVAKKWAQSLAAIARPEAVSASRSPLSVA